jgi:isochorismate synthase
MPESNSIKGYIAYSLPQSKDHYYCEIEETHIRNKDNINEDVDFILAPFNKNETPTYLFKFKSKILNGALSTSYLKAIEYVEGTKAGYISTCSKLIDCIRNNNVSKVVLSRTKFIEATHVNIDKVFNQLKEQYPDTFVYALHHEEIGTWIAASPELLIRSSEENYITDALAGTRSANSDSITQWGQKEIEEHRYIETYVNEKLDNLNATYSKSDTETLQAGRIEHIHSRYHINKKEINLTDLLKELHPGPAISGYPSEDAISIIEKIENHKRLYYCGYLGLIDKHKNESDLYINLRCMQVFSNGYKLYIGGGITIDSDPELEWQETEMKSETLSLIIKSAH